MPPPPPTPGCSPSPRRPVEACLVWTLWSHPVTRSTGGSGVVSKHMRLPGNASLRRFLATRWLVRACVAAISDSPRLFFWGVSTLQRHASLFVTLSPCVRRPVSSHALRPIRVHDPKQDAAALVPAKQQSCLSPGVFVGATSSSPFSLWAYVYA